MLCSRCNHRESEHNKDVCSVCSISLVGQKIESFGFGETSEDMSDFEIVRHHTVRMLMDGCRECGNKDFGFEVGVKEESELKWYVAHIHCGNCHTQYKEIMEVRINESDKDSK
jgi:hypothetical protein|tara:strand:- start:661 stop:999 length:339 start_codon:yes stop_codon:yes gene_type:complete